ncbi:MAG: TRAP transporter fused permease subunit [Betaproteobacteria bacterium]|nr:TRAP transporter fused permease subunit [Betaproteobacteria bacterium]MBI2225420.1 TRAP transporter fused permease subunit [Betaproteobacteria bacterium]MBI3052687.1 TRAP transporter fused permease subunit [Betaproteobacteria bacterium]
MQLSATGVRWLLGAIAVTLTVVEFSQFMLGRSLDHLTFLGIHVGAAAAVTFLICGWRERHGPDQPVSLPNLLLALAALASAGYFALQGPRVTERIAGVDPVFSLDIVFGILLILVLLEACRRIAGIVLTVIAVIFIVYILLGPYLPGGLAHRGLSLMRFIDLQVLSTQGIFGTPISASAHMVFYFVMVGAFLERSGAGRLFVDLAYCLTGRAWGGAGKASVISSSLFGTVSGSAVANVLMTGVVTIPLMKRSGLKPSMAAAIEATASTGGQLAPPIMGAAAFILADIVGVSYASVAVAAIMPAFLYYLSLYAVVDCQARRGGLGPDPSLPVAESLAGLRARWHLIPPLFLMIYLLMSHYSLMMTGGITVLAIVAVSWMRTATRMNVKTIFDAIVTAARTTVDVAIPSAVAGIIVGTLVETGMALTMQRWLLNIAGNSLMISLVGAMLLAIVFGMGMPTAAAYLVSAILVAPALQELGVPALAAHLFVFYFAILSMVTPPVALAAYAAAGISRSNLWTTGWIAFALAIPGFLIPYAFVFDQGILLQGETLHIARVLVTATIGVLGLSAATGGYAFGPLNWPLRLALFCFSPLLIDPRHFTDLVGLGGIAVIIGYQIWRYKRSGRPKPFAAPTQS